MKFNETHRFEKRKQYPSFSGSQLKHFLKYTSISLKITNRKLKNV